MKFKVGDRVAVYSGTHILKGSVFNAHKDGEYAGMLDIKLDGDFGGVQPYHYKQCRLLKKKGLLGMALLKSDGFEQWTKCLKAIFDQTDEFIELREVRNKK